MRPYDPSPTPTTRKPQNPSRDTTHTTEILKYFTVKNPNLTQHFS